LAREALAARGHRSASAAAGKACKTVAKFAFLYDGAMSKDLNFVPFDEVRPADFVAIHENEKAG